MNIILTIKSFLNYLYNNLIDLVWVKKIKFEDGTELSTVPKVDSFNLFDIKRTSQRIAQKNWSCISYPTQNKLNKSDVASVYDILKDKLDNADGAMSAPTSVSGNYPQVFCDGWYYFINESDSYKIYRSKYIDLSNSEFFANTSTISPPRILLKAEFENKKYIVILHTNIYNYTLYIDAFDVDTKTKYANTFTSYYTIMEPIHLNNQEIPIINNNGYFILRSRGTQIYHFGIYKIDSNGTVSRMKHFDNGNGQGIGNWLLANSFNGFTVDDNFARTIHNACAFNNKLYFSSAGVLLWYDPQTDEINYIDTFITDKGYYVNSGRYGDLGSRLFIYNNKLTLINVDFEVKEYNNVQGQHFYIYQMNDDNTWSLLKSVDISNNPIYTNYNFNTFPLVYVSYETEYKDVQSAIKTASIDNSGYFHFVCKKVSDTKQIIEYKTNSFNNNNFIDIITTTDSGVSVYDLIINDSNYVYLTYYWNTYIYTDFVLTIYTDTINGIDIKYYKNGDWKICTPDIAVGNDDNLQSVYEYLGYLDYWWIDENNEQISLGRNSNFLTFMYVGDEYEENAEDLPTGNYKISSNVIVLSSAPTTSTVSNIGNICINTSDNSAYICTNINNGSYTWSQITLV